MSIETGTTACAPRPAEKSGGSTGKAHSAAGDGTGASGGPTFLSLLTAMEPDATVPADDDTAAAEAMANSEDAAQPALLPPDAAALLAQNLSPRRKLADTDAAVLAAQGGLAALPAEDAAVTGAADAVEALGADGRMAHEVYLSGHVKLADADGTVLASHGALAGVHAQTAAVTGVAQAAEVLSADGRVAQGVEEFIAKTDMSATNSKLAGHAASAGLAADGVATTTQTDGLQHVPTPQSTARRTDADRAAQEVGGSPPTKGAEARADASNRAADMVGADWRSTLAAQSASAPVAGSPKADVLGAFSKGATNARTERSSLRPLFVPAGSALAGSWTEQAASGGNVATGASFAPTLATAVPETALAEKLNYWISRGVQNAELQLDAFGGGTVKVSIAVQGNEAQVEFRSDQPEARRLLQDAMPQLRDMLRGEGLELSGGFVGTSGRQESGAQERRSNPQGFRSGVVNIEAAVAGASAGLSRTPGRAVDLFV